MSLVKHGEHPFWTPWAPNEFHGSLDAKEDQVLKKVTQERLRSLWHRRKSEDQLGYEIHVCIVGRGNREEVPTQNKKRKWKLWNTDWYPVSCAILGSPSPRYWINQRNSKPKQISRMRQNSFQGVRADLRKEMCVPTAITMENSLSASLEDWKIGK